MGVVPLQLHRGKTAETLPFSSQFFPAAFLHSAFLVLVLQLRLSFKATKILLTLTSCLLARTTPLRAPQRTPLPFPECVCTQSELCLVNRIHLATSRDQQPLGFAPAQNAKYYAALAENLDALKEMGVRNKARLNMKLFSD
uniref:GM04590p n=1 Tax=Drosophila melanogaster TaxID=7227 RepID=Q3ZAJ8_DROME|nr:GM04590p [Drosophila melanogaster]